MSHPTQQDEEALRSADKWAGFCSPKSYRKGRQNAVMAQDPQPHGNTEAGTTKEGGVDK